MIYARHTWRELVTVKSQANTVVLLLTANIPIIHVTPIRGRSTIEALMAVLLVTGENGA